MRVLEEDRSGDAPFPIFEFAVAVELAPPEVPVAFEGLPGLGEEWGPSSSTFPPMSDKGEKMG